MTAFVDREDEIEAPSSRVPGGGGRPRGRAAWSLLPRFGSLQVGMPDS